MREATEITGLTRETLTKAAGRGEIPGAIQRKPNTPWFFTVTGLRRFVGIPDDAPATPRAVSA